MNFKELLKEAIKTNTKIIITGKSGWGKSEMIQQVADELNLILVDFRLSEVLPEDLIGIPKLRDDYYDYVPPKWLYEIVSNPDKQYLLFLDEITQGTPEVLNICYKIFDKVTRIGNYTLNNVSVVGATNYSEESNYLTELPEPLKKRACMLELDHNPETAMTYLYEKYPQIPENPVSKSILKRILKDSNPRGLEKAINLVLQDSSFQLCVPYIGLTGYNLLKTIIQTGGISELTNLNKALNALLDRKFIYNDKEFQVNVMPDLVYAFNLNEEETEILLSSNDLYTAPDIITPDFYYEYLESQPNLTRELLDDIIELCPVFNPLVFLTNHKWNSEQISTLFPSISSATATPYKQLFKLLLTKKALPIEIMREYKDDMPWDALYDEYKKGWLTKAKVKEFETQLQSIAIVRGEKWEA